MMTKKQLTLVIEWLKEVDSHTVYDEATLKEGLPSVGIVYDPEGRTISCEGRRVSAPVHSPEYFKRTSKFGASLEPGNWRGFVGHEIVLTMCRLARIVNVDDFLLKYKGRGFRFRACLDALEDKLRAYR